MRNVTLGAIGALLASTAIASAGGIDRSGQSVGILFEEGTYVELSYGYVDPSVSGEDPFTLDTDDMSPSYSMIAGGFKTDLTDNISVAVIFDQPFGSVANYSAGFYSGTNADLSSNAITVLASYDLGENIVAYAGAASQSMSANVSVMTPAPFLLDYMAVGDSSRGTGYVVGGAYQIPEIALRVALTYRSEITSELATVESFLEPVVVPFIPTTTSITTPQSITLDFQSGVNEQTLVFGSIRWVEWSKFDISPFSYPDNPIVSYEDDVVTYSLGVGRQLTENLSGALTVGYEATLGSDPSPLAPTDGFVSVGAGLTYAFDNVEITGGVKYLWIGDASGPKGTFEDNNAMAFGLKVAFAL